MENTDENIVSLTGYRGEMTKPIIDMNAEELKVWEKEINQKIRKDLFAINMPFVHKIDGKIVAELADGTIEIIK
jgi:hypothetical protein